MHIVIIYYNNMHLFQKLHLDPQNDTTLARQLTQQLTWLIVNKELKSGDQLPTVRAMAERLGINLHTVRSAYRKLEEEQLVQIRQGRGTHVLPFDFFRFAQVTDDQRSHTIGVIIPTWENPFYHALLQGVEQVAEQDQTMLFLCNTHDDMGAAVRDFARLSAKRVDGILVFSNDLVDLSSSQTRDSDHPKGMPLVTVDWPGCSGFSVNIDLETAGYLPTRHLLEHGHKRIGLITNAIDVPNTTPVNSGYHRAHQEMGLAIDPELIIRVEGYDLNSGGQGARRLLSLDHPPSAIFCITDLLAMGAMRTIKEIGLRIPDDVALASFNDIPAAALVDPPLTTVSVPGKHMGQIAMHMLSQLINNEQPDSPVITLPTSLIIRASCGTHPIQPNEKRKKVECK
jgi:LacI family transcriptional regulator